MKRAIKKMANALGYEISKKVEARKNSELSDYPCIDVLDLVVQDYMKQQPDLFFIQIGAHDGVSADPVARQIRKYHWRGILVEPQPRSFQHLVANYQGENQLIFEQVVIGAEDGNATFYTIREDIPGLPFWLPQSASLDRDWVLNALYYWKNVKKIENIPEDFDSLIEEFFVPQMTLKTLLGKHNIEKLDLLAMATPFDFEILQMIPFDRIKPSLICFEYFSISEREACLRFLQDHGYSVGRFASRAVASLNSPVLNWTISDY
jgi:FkbM family methyltransferase